MFYASRLLLIFCCHYYSLSDCMLYHASKLKNFSLQKFLCIICYGELRRSYPDLRGMAHIGALSKH